MEKKYIYLGITVILFLLTVTSSVAGYRTLTSRGEYSEVIDISNYVDPGLSIEASGYIFSPEFSYSVNGVRYSTEYRAGSFPADAMQVSIKDINCFRDNGSYHFYGVKFDEGKKRIARMSGVIFGENVVYSVENLVDKDSLFAYDVSFVESGENNTIEVFYHPNPIRYAISFSVVVIFLGAVVLGLGSSFIECRRRAKRRS